MFEGAALWATASHCGRASASPNEADASNEVEPALLYNSVFHLEEQIVPGSA